MSNLPITDSGFKIRRSAGSVGLDLDDHNVRLTQDLPDPAPGYQARFGRGNWSTICDFGDEGGDSFPLRIRSTVASITRSGLEIGGVKIVEYDIPFIDNSSLWNAMDSESQAAVELAEAVMAAWPDFTSTVIDYGRVMELRRLWVEPGETVSAVWVPVVQELFRRVKSETAIMIAKAFPLEYEHKVGTENLPAFEKRRRAMMRHYAYHLGLNALPGASGENGWIWKANERCKNRIPTPVFDPSRRSEIWEA